LRGPQTTRTIETACAQHRTHDAGEITTPPRRNIMQPSELQDYLHAHIPLSRAMDVRVQAASSELVRLEAPLAPNINHRSTVFGGSASALAILSAWALLLVRTRAHGIDARLVIRRNSMSYDQPMHTDFSAVCMAPPPQEWDQFVRTLARKPRARIELRSQVSCGGEATGEMVGEFVALRG
jgi:thioesterase domain-containing protein